MNRDILKEAILNHDDASLKNLISAGADPDQPDSFGVVPLFHAINFGTLESLEMLLAAGADVNHSCWQKQSPWFLAVKSRDMAKIHLLEKYHADQTIQNKHGDNALHLLAMRGDLRLFHYMIHHSPEQAILAVNSRGNTLLHLTASWNNQLLTRICLTHTSIPIDAVNTEGETAFLKAIKSANIAIARILRNAGCNIKHVDNSGLNSLSAAIRYMKADSDTLELITDLLKNGTAPDQENQDKETPLWLAVKRNWHEAVKLLLEYPVDVNHAVDKKTPLVMAYLQSDIKMTALLLTANADPNVQLDKKSLLSLAIETHQLEIAELLQNAGRRTTKLYRHLCDEAYKAQ